LLALRRPDVLPDWYRHSPSSGNLYREAADAWLWRYGFGKKDERNARMAMGSAAEHGVNLAMTSDMSDDDAAKAAVAEFDKRMEGEVSAERDAVPLICKQMLAKLRSLGKPLTIQQVVNVPTGQKYGFAYPVKGVVDLSYEGFDIDLKATMACPSSPKFSHVAQVGTYAELRQKPQKVLYATPKRAELYDITLEDAAYGWSVMRSSWLKIEALAQRFNRPEDALSVIPFNPDSFYWSDAKSKAEAATVWRI
jgi:hypothetical protein